MIYRGACHCGAASVVYETDAPVRLRQDGCSFCTSRGAKSASDPNGKLAVSSTRRLVRYRFGHRSADFLICGICGAYIAACMQSESGPIGVLNVVGAQIAELKDGHATLASLDGETPAERIARRVSRWTPLTLQEPAL